LHVPGVADDGARAVGVFEIPEKLRKLRYFGDGVGRNAA